MTIEQFFFFHHFSYNFDSFQKKYYFIFFMKIKKVYFMSLFLILFLVSVFAQFYYLLSLRNWTLTPLSSEKFTFIVWLSKKWSSFNSVKFVLIVWIKNLVFKKWVAKEILPFNSFILIDYKYFLQEVLGFCRYWF